ncbi:hypothetical protein MUO14_03435 [Halobacillus shinanisalinarum]|uniref:Uncharacterized protein n=1 Tax=Halobacillus shinanisalinarum TaxID=2932258 RepID=A0ABY4H1J2_9BACI|nr:hypothetical protein [Halobacillus shinanisalinarum]UOQ94035.1 hypothetical protein MUO14_03435 [Halobacillus shinanisalinarum]
MKFLFFAFILITVITGCSQADSSDQGASKEITSPFQGKVEHVHGMGYLDEDTLAFASHTGLKLYQDEKWAQTTSHKNDYMGFNVVDEGFYTSGHPGQESNLPNPIGIQKAAGIDKGLKSLALEGESDFHAMGVGYRNHSIYVLNQRANSLMDLGLYRSFDDGKTWGKLRAENLPENIFQIAVHPDNEQMVSVATKTGIYLSRDAGDTFKLISEEGQGSGLFFTKEKLYYGIYNNEGQSFKAYSLSDGSKQELSLPELEEDALMYVAKPPKQNEKIAIFTVNGSSFVSKDSGQTWTQILEEGETIIN